jgi:hypothetical protein
MTIWRMRFTRSIPKATDTYSEYVILIAFLLQQWFDERASMIRFTYIACNFNFCTLILNFRLIILIHFDLRLYVIMCLRQHH